MQKPPSTHVLNALVIALLLFACACTEEASPSTGLVVVTANAFENDSAMNWKFLGSGWRVVATDEGHVLEGRDATSALHALAMREPRISMSLRLVEGDVVLGFLADLGPIQANIGLGHSHGDTGHAHGIFGHATLPIGRLALDLEGYALHVHADRLILFTTPSETGQVLAEVPFAYGLNTLRTIDIRVDDGEPTDTPTAQTIVVHIDKTKVLEIAHPVAPCALDDSCESSTSGTQPPLHRGVYIEPTANAIVHVDNTQLAVQGMPSLGFVQAGVMHGGGATAMTFSRTEPDTVYLITGYNALGAWRSEDGGKTWNRFYEGLHLTSLVLDTEFPEHILIGDNIGQIIRSTNRGLSWDIVSAAPDLADFQEGYAPSIHGMVADPQDPTRFYAASSEGRFLVSSDRGSEWLALDATYPNATSLAMDQGGSGILYVGSTDGVWRSADEGQSWEPTATLPGITHSVVTQPGTAGVVLAGTTEGLFFSDDSGDTWVPRTDGLTYDDITVLEWSSADPNTVLAGTYKGIFISRDGSQSWQSHSNGLTNPDTGAIAASPSDANHFVSATADWWFNVKPGDHVHFQGPKHATPGTFSTTDGGEAWTSLGNDYQDRDAYALAVDPNNPETVFIGTMCSRGLFRSNDLGNTFTHLPTLASHYTMRLEVAPWNGRTVYMTSAFGIHRSNDEGATWLDLIEGGHFHGLAVAPDQTIYAGTAPADGGAAGGGGRSGSFQGLDLDGSYAFRSDDGGDSWKTIMEGLPDGTIKTSAINTIALAPSNPQVVYLGFDGSHSMNSSMFVEAAGIYRSDNRGENWTAQNQGLPSKTVLDMAVGSTNADRVFAATQRGLARSIDGGASWSRVLPERSTAVALGVDGLVVAGTYGTVVVSKDNGDSWRAIQGNLGGQAVWDVAVTPSHNVVLAGVRDRGLMRLNLKAALTSLP